MNIHFIIHESFEAPGAYALWAQDRGHNASFTHLHEGEQLPNNSDNFDMLIVLGGPQSPDTTTEECPHFDAKKEKALIKSAIQSNKIIIGICLGAQLVGEALSAKYDHSPNKEIGSFPIVLTPEGKNHKFFQDFPSPAIVGHWHNDMPGLTSDAKILAYSEGCPRQIVEYAPFIYGFQCHLEFNADCIVGITEHSRSELETLKELPYIQQPETLLSNDYTQMNALLYSFLDKITAAYSAQ